MLRQYRGALVMSVSRSFAVVAALRPARTQRGLSSSLAQHCSQDCWSKGETLFATLPRECGPVRSSTVEVVSGANAVAVGSEISVSDSGELTLVPKQDSVWMLRLEGVVIPMRPSDWGWSFVSKLVVALGLYASGGVLLARSRGSALVQENRAVIQEARTWPDQNQSLVQRRGHVVQDGTRPVVQGGVCIAEPCPAYG